MNYKLIIYLNTNLTTLDYMIIVHDWDHPYPGKKDALKRSFKLFVYVLSRYIPILKPFCADVYEEHKKWVDIYNELEKLQKVKAIYGIRPEAKKEFDKFIKKLEKDQDVRLHLHLWDENDRKIFKSKVGNLPDTRNAVVWIPKLKGKDLVLPHEKIDFMDRPNTNLEQLKKLGKDAIVVFHPDYKDKSFLLYLKFLNYLKRKR